MQQDFSLFTDKARTAITKAFQLSVSCKHPCVDSPVMMVSLIQEGKEMVFFLLQEMDVDRNGFCQAISDSVQTLPHTGNGDIQMSSYLQSVLSKSINIATADGSRVAALEHIFWAFAVTPGAIKSIMSSFGITESKVRSAVGAFRNGNIDRIDTPHSSHEGGLKNLNKYAQNMMILAQEGRIDPVIGRDDEIRRILQILSRKTKNNPILVGDPGTGKTAIVEGLAHRFLRGDVPQELSGFKLYSLDISSLIAGTAQHGEFEERLKRVITDAKSDPDIILFIDEMHLLIGAGGVVNAANILKPELARGELKIIGATTNDEYTKYIETDKAFERRFQKISVEEPDGETAVTIMRGIKSRFESFHRIKILDEAIVAAVRLTQRYIPTRHLPDKAIDVIDEAASRMRIERSSVPVELDTLAAEIRSKEMERESLRQDENQHDLRALDEEIANLREKENALNAKWQNERERMESLQSTRNELERQRINYEQAERSGQYHAAVTIKNQMVLLQHSIQDLLDDVRDTESPLLKSAVDENDVRDVIQMWTGIPVSKLGDDESGRLLHLEEILRQSVIGQDAAVSSVSKVIRRNRMGFSDAGKPVGSFLFLGTTGVGKTELAKALAEYLFDSKEMLVRIDMSEYQQEHSVSRLFGAPPGYVGYDQGGQLTEAVRCKPYSVILLDEIEKAHPKVFETLLQVLDDGRMTDGQGRLVDFKNTIIIMTSNMKANLKEKVAPEFLNRIDEIISFKPLSMEHIRQIASLQLSSLRKKMLKNGVEISFDNAATDYISEKGYVPEYGARPVKRVINDFIVNELTMKILSGEIDRTRKISVTGINDQLVFSND